MTVQENRELIVKLGYLVIITGAVYALIVVLAVSVML